MTRGLRNTLIGSGLLVATAPLVVVSVAILFVGHAPWKIPEEWRPPSALTEPGGIAVRYLGVSTYEVSDGQTTVLLDAGVTRPTMWQLATSPVESDPGIVDQWIRQVDFVLINHAHYDHLLDAPRIAEVTGAIIVGSRSTCNFALSRGVPREQVREVEGGARLKLGSFDVIVQETEHSPLFGRDDLMRGTIDSEVGSLWFWQMEQDATLIYRLQSGNRSLLFHSSSRYTPHPDLEPVDLLIYGISGKGLDADKAARVIAAFQPKLFLPTHYDNFFQPLELGLALLPTNDLMGAHAAVRAAAPQLPWVVLDYGQKIHFHGRTDGSTDD